MCDPREQRVLPRKTRSIKEQPPSNEYAAGDEHGDEELSPQRKTRVHIAFHCEIPARVQTCSGECHERGGQHVVRLAINVAINTAQ